MSELKNKLSKIKGLGFIVLALIAGIALLLLPNGKSDKKADISSSEFGNADKFTETIEKRISEIVRGLEGVKGCRVMVTLENGYSYLYATDQQMITNGEDRDVKKEMVIINKNGEEAPIVISEYIPEIKGVAVVYEGAASTESIRALIATLFKLPDEAIYVSGSIK